MILHLTAKLLSEKTHVNGFQETEHWKQECAPVHFDDLFDDPIFEMLFSKKESSDSERLLCFAKAKK